MLNHYNTLGQISKIVDSKHNYTKPVFDYGDSTTDPSFYEPMQSQIANMRQSSTFTDGLFDFDSADKVPVDVQAPIGRKLGITQEEISNINNHLSENLKNRAENQAQSKKDYDEYNKKLAESVKVVSDTLNSQNNNSVDNSDNN